jgi:hypothetical protein
MINSQQMSKALFGIMKIALYLSSLGQWYFYKSIVLCVTVNLYLNTENQRKITWLHH